MAPFQFLPFESQPRLEMRQSAASPVEITLTITRATTTIATAMDLGGATASPTSAAAVTPTAPATTTLPAAKSADNNGVVAGAVLGSILGFAVLVVFIYKCCFNPRSALYIGYSYDSDYDYRSESTSRSDDVRRRGGWGSFEKHRRDTIRRPERVRTRRHRRDRSRSTSPTRSETTRSYYYKDRRPSSGMVKKNGMLGWALAPGYERRYSGRRDIWAGERSTTTKMQFLVDD
jgi:hypothetical protein